MRLYVLEDKLCCVVHESQHVSEWASYVESVSLKCDLSKGYDRTRVGLLGLPGHPHVPYSQTPLRKSSTAYPEPIPLRGLQNLPGEGVDVLEAVHLARCTSDPLLHQRSDPAQPDTICFERAAAAGMG